MFGNSVWSKLRRGSEHHWGCPSHGFHTHLRLEHLVSLLEVGDVIPLASLYQEMGPTGLFKLQDFPLQASKCVFLLT